MKIETKKLENEIQAKISVPMFEEKELETFDNNIHNIAKEYCEMHLKEKDQILTQRLIKMLEDENKKQKKVLDKIRKNNKRIIDYGFDYDGFNNVEDLKKLIDMLVDYAKQNDELLEEIE